MPGTTTWKELRPKLVKAEDEPHPAQACQQMQAGLRLATLRKHRKRSQAAVAKKLAVSQSSISQLEHCDDPRLSTVAGYVSALGGRLELRAVFDDETITI
jgi:DNA-binding XRE family transcriptional regulator